MICAKLNNLYLQRWMCFDYVERFALLLNDLNGSMKLLPGKNPLENCLETFSPWKSQQWTLPHEKTSLLKIPPVKTALQQIKKRLSLKSKIMKIMAGGIGTLQKSSRVPYLLERALMLERAPHSN